MSTITSIVVYENYIYVGTLLDGIFRLNITFSNEKAADSLLTGVVITSLVSVGDTLFAGTNNGVYISDNNGTSWRPWNGVAWNYPRITSLVATNGAIFAGSMGILSSQLEYYGSGNGV